MLTNKKYSGRMPLVVVAALLSLMIMLPLAGCKNDTVPPEVAKQEQADGGGSETDKNDTVPETPAAKLVSITVTSPTRTVYSVGDSFDSTGMKVTATYDDGETRPVTGTIATDTSTLTQSAGIGKTVTVSYSEGDTTQKDDFTVDVASYQFTETVQDVDSSYTGTMAGGDYRIFGDWPQTVKGKDVTIGTGTLVRGGLTYHVGDDGNYYVEEEENANGTGTQYKYSNGDQAGQGGETTQWFKVEPIVWRVLTTSYKAPEGGTVGEVLLLAESILTGGIKWADSSNNYMQSYIRKWLNGNSGTGAASDYSGDPGFMQTAFTESAWNLIADTTVDNSAASTFGTGESVVENPYACGNTTDKVFLLSEAEGTTSEYGFAAYDAYGQGSTRIRVTTDYAKATGAYQSSTEGYGGWWWLRSPYCYYGYSARCIFDVGNAYDFISVCSTFGGVVPALSISLK